jgi:site-specific recombinase XerC
MMRILKMAKASYGRKELLTPNPKAPLREQVREVLRFHHYSLRTERAYWQWIRRYLAFHRSPDHSGPQKGWRHPKTMGAPEVAQFLAHLAVAGNVAASTQNQALNALVLLYERVLEQPLEGRVNAVRASRAPRVPVVLTPEEAQRVIALLNGAPQLVVKLLYGSGLRLMEALRLRVRVKRFAPRGLTFKIQCPTSNVEGRGSRRTETFNIQHSMSNPPSHRSYEGQASKVERRNRRDACAALEVGERVFYFLRAKICRTASGTDRITQLHPNQSPRRW